MVSARRLLAFVGTALTVVVLSIGLFSATALAKDSGAKIRMLDDCDPKTFNAALKDPKACVGKGDTTFDEFIQELTRTKTVEDWRFKPDEKKVKAGRPILVENRGGETHTFTCVTKFGGGIVGLLNTLSGNTTPATLCNGEKVVPDGNPPVGPLTAQTFVPSGGKLLVNLNDKSIQQSPKNSGRYLFECLIHPWMRTVLIVDKDNRDNDNRDNDNRDRDGRD